MSKADKMFKELGYKLMPILPNNTYNYLNTKNEDLFLI